MVTKQLKDSNVSMSSKMNVLTLRSLELELLTADECISL